MTRKKNPIKKRLTKGLNRRMLKIILIIGLLVSLISVIVIHHDIIFNSYPTIVMQYKMRYNEMNDVQYKNDLFNYIEQVMNESIVGLNYTQLLTWEHKYLAYWGGELQVRPEMPIEILSTNLFGMIQMKNLMLRYAIYCTKTQTFIVYLSEGETTADILAESWNWEGFAVGRCGEFALLYNGLLLANGYRSRIVVDCSVSTDGRVAGDHVWNEVFINETWIHIDPTESLINQPDMYANPDRWNKCVNLVYGIEGNEIVNLTEKYQFK